MSDPASFSTAVPGASLRAGAPAQTGWIRSVRSRWAAVAAWLFLATSNPLGDEVPRLGLTDLEAQGLPAGEAGRLTERLRSELLRTGKVRLVERQAVDRVLREQAFQNSGACGQECAARLGTMLSAQAMLIPSVRCGRERCTLGARLVDVGSGEVTVSVDQDGPIGAWEDAVPALVERLLEAMRERTAFQAPGELHVEVDDSRASLRLDGIPVAGSGSFVLEGLAAGPHRLEARTADRRAVQEIRLEPGQVRRVGLELTPATGQVMLLSRPLGAQVFSERLLIGETPQRSLALAVGWRTLHFRKLGYLDTALTVAVDMDSVRRVHVQLAPAGTLQFDPPVEATARLWQAGSPLTADASARTPLRTGRWHLKLSAPGWVPVDREIEIAHGRTTLLSLERAQVPEAPEVGR